MVSGGTEKVLWSLKILVEGHFVMFYITLRQGQIKVCLPGQRRRDRDKDRDRGPNLNKHTKTEAEHMAGNVSYFHSVWFESLLEEMFPIQSDLLQEKKEKEKGRRYIYLTSG